MPVVDLLGADARQIDWTNLLGAEPATEVLEGRMHLDFVSTGVGVVADTDGLIFAVHLHGQGHEGFDQYDGELPEGLALGTSRRRARELFGFPDQAGESVEIRPLGRMPAWDRWERDGWFLHARYGDSGVELITLGTRGQGT